MQHSADAALLSLGGDEIEEVGNSVSLHRWSLG